jgi:hypothetical protein
MTSQTPSQHCLIIWKFKRHTRKQSLAEMSRSTTWISWSMNWTPDQSSPWYCTRRGERSKCMINAVPWTMLQPRVALRRFWKVCLLGSCGNTWLGVTVPWCMLFVNEIFTPSGTAEVDLSIILCEYKPLWWAALVVQLVLCLVYEHSLMDGLLKYIQVSLTVLCSTCNWYISSYRCNYMPLKKKAFNTQLTCE